MGRSSHVAENAAEAAVSHISVVAATVELKSLLEERRRAAHAVVLRQEHSISNAFAII